MCISYTCMNYGLPGTVVANTGTTYILPATGRSDTWVDILVPMRIYQQLVPYMMYMEDADESACRIKQGGIWAPESASRLFGEDMRYLPVGDTKKISKYTSLIGS